MIIQRTTQKNAVWLLIFDQIFWFSTVVAVFAQVDVNNKCVMEIKDASQQILGKNTWWIVSLIGLNWRTQIYRIEKGTVVGAEL